MEEIYKPETEDAGKVEVYSRENNEMLGDMPQWLIHTGSYIVYGLIVFLVAGTALFKYPNVSFRFTCDWFSMKKRSIIPP